MSDAVGWKNYLQDILAEKDRAVAMADRERELSAAALRGEHQRAEDQASREREKAATNLRIELARSIKEGDDRLREHIANQIMQINAALVSAELLEKERLARVDATIDALSEKLEVVRQAAAIAQTKFEDDVKGRFANVNEFRDALDDLGKQMATRRELEDAKVSQIESRDQLQTAIAELRSRLDVGPAGLASLQSRADVSQGKSAGISATVALAIAGGTLLLSVVIVAANLLTGS